MKIINPSKKGIFIVLEGPEGAGKTTQCRLLENYFIKNYSKRRFLFTREPGGTPYAESLRSIALSPDLERSPLAEMLTFIAARADHIDRHIRPALLSGIDVICDRFTLSTLCHQGQSVPLEIVKSADRIARFGLEPDLTLILDIPTDISRKRVQKRGAIQDRFDKKSDAYHEKVYAMMKKGPKTGPFKIINAEKSEQNVHEEILSAIKILIEKN